MKLDIDGVSAGYEGTAIIRDIDCTVEDGEIVGIMGKNGVGKTTLLKTIMGLLEPDAGAIRAGEQTLVDVGESDDGGALDGIRNRVGSTRGLSADERAALGIGYVPQGRDVFPGLTVEQNLLVGESVGESKETLYDHVYDLFPILEQRADQDAETMSGGQQQMLAIGRALVGDPDLLLVDEPSEGVQPSIVQQITEDLAEINDELGTTILFVEQNLSVIRGLADRCYAMDKGRIVAELHGADLQDDDALADHLAV
jgi:urea transport system ATP-binding protein